MLSTMNYHHMIIFADRHHFVTNLLIKKLRVILIQANFHLDDTTVFMSILEKDIAADTMSNTDPERCEGHHNKMNQQIIVRSCINLTYDIKLGETLTNRQDCHKISMGILVRCSPFVDLLIHQQILL